MDVLEKARELAKALEESPEVQQFRRLEMEVERDAEAKKLWTELFSAEKEMQALIGAGRNIPSEQVSSLEKLRETVHSNTLASKFLEAQMAYYNLLEGVNFILRNALNTENSQAGSGCGGCQGCLAKTH